MVFERKDHGFEFYLPWSTSVLDSPLFVVVSVLKNNVYYCLIDSGIKEKKLQKLNLTVKVISPPQSHFSL